MIESHEVLRAVIIDAYAKATGRTSQDPQVHTSVDFLLDEVWAKVSVPDNFHHYRRVSASDARAELAWLAAEPEKAHVRLTELSETAMLALDSVDAIGELRAEFFASEPALLNAVCESGDVGRFTRQKGRPASDMAQVITAWLAIHYRQLTGKYASMIRTHFTRHLLASHFVS
ncbi:MAG: hypothetical protein V4688_07390, partial [Pseudomonadota bacterium]